MSKTSVIGALPSCSDHFSIDHTWNYCFIHCCVLNDLWAYVCTHRYELKKPNQQKQTPKIPPEVELDHLSHEGSCVFKNCICSNIRINFALNLVYKRHTETNMKCFFIGTDRVRTQSVGVASGSESSLFIHKAQKTNFCIWCYSQ